MKDWMKYWAGSIILFGITIFCTYVIFTFFTTEVYYYEYTKNGEKWRGVAKLSDATEIKPFLTRNTTDNINVDFSSIRIVGK